MNKPKLSVVITSVANPSIYKEFNKVNGLLNITIDGVSNDVPHYGIISRTGSVEIIDIEGWLKEQSDNNILPDITIDIKLNGVLLFSFDSENEITFTQQDNKVKINLLDSINSLQDIMFNNNIYMTDTNAYSLLVEVLSSYNITVNMDQNTKEELINIKIPRIVITSNTMWDFISGFASGCCGIFYKQGSLYYFKVLGE